MLNRFLNFLLLGYLAELIFALAAFAVAGYALYLILGAIEWWCQNCCW